VQSTSRDGADWQPNCARPCELGSYIDNAGEVYQTQENVCRCQSARHPGGIRMVQS
jgi:hypothetical protein